jgi:hypothetical protein
VTATPVTAPRPCRKAEQVAGYVAKYATKGTEAVGVTLDHRVCEVELEGLDVPSHMAELVRAC